MSDEQRHQIEQQQQIQHSQQLPRRYNCCRLCLAPDNECISILNSYAADKEPLASKIHACLSIKISITDHLSVRICHSCISFLNSWQSFKNRCVAAQTKQRSWQENSNKSIQSADQHHQTADNLYDDQHHQNQYHPQQYLQQQDEQNSLASSILEGISTLKKRKSITVYVSPKSQQCKQQQEKLLHKQQLNVVMPLTKRHYTKHKYNKSHRQLQSQTSETEPQRTATTAHHVQTLYSKIKQKSDKKQISSSQQPLSTSAPLQQSFVVPAVPCVVAPLTSCTNTVPTVATAATTSTTATPTPSLDILTSTTMTTTAMAPRSSSSVHPITAAVAAGSSDDCLVVGSNTSSSNISCTSAVQQLRLFRRYSYNPLPAVQIKDEPLEAEDEYSEGKLQPHDESDEMVVDPTMFLERTTDEGEFMESTSNYDYDLIRPPADLKPLPASTTIRMSTKEAACRACNLKFSTRANARRHEKNLHPNLFETLEENEQSINKQNAALNASLELQRAVAAAMAADACKFSSGVVITPQKYRQEVVNAFNNSEFGFDYDNPEKYRELLTDEKIIFLQQNDEFLRQYQSMTCRCCNKYYSTYKNFMAHMRKKYLTLPRNCCFNCLKLNDSKALFISHLKKRNCINLHKVLHNLMAGNKSFADAVAATVAAAPEKLRAKELLINKMYECKLCPKTFRLKLEFRSHVYDEHSNGQPRDVSNSRCCYCGVDIEDPADRKRHYNNMDCIVTLRCVTCDMKHETQQKFMEHVQDKHFSNFGEQSKIVSTADKSPSKITTGSSAADDSRSGNLNVSLINTTPKAQYFSRMPQACPICGQQYNNYNNVLRHMESKHPDQLPQTYKCVKCGQGYPRLSNLREHMVSAHGADKARHTGFEYIVNADAVKNTSGTTASAQNPYTGRYDYVMKDLMSITNGGTVAEEDCDNENAAKKMRLDSSISVNNNNSSGTNVSQRECSICNAVFANNIGLSNHMRSHQSAHNSGYSVSNSKAGASGNTNQQSTTGQHQILRKSLEQAADRRFRRMRCRICQRRFSSKKSYRYHMLNDHQIRNVQFIKCKLCDAEFAYEKGLKVHMFKIHNTLLKDDMIIKQYECEICYIVYRTDVELQHHLANVHKKHGEPSNYDEDDMYNADESVCVVNPDNTSVAANVSGVSTPASGIGFGETQAGPLYWYQCKYCPSNFNTNKKLAIHINSHDEFDSNDYSCKDCGNVYSGRKSLWVHRYKKHPQIPEPSECVMCKKVFFDNQMLEHHIPSCNRKPITQAVHDNATAIYKHKTGDDEDEDDDEHSRDATKSLSTAINATVGSASSLKIKLPEVACTICGARFSDQDLFAKHIQVHERELYTDNPLTAMFDTEPADPNQFYMDCKNDNGEYACDLCAKKFTQMTALKVHRKWHFRGDSKQNEADQHTLSNSHIQHSQHQQQAIKVQQHQQQQQQQTKSKMPISHQHLLGLQAVGLMPRQFSTLGGSHRTQKRKRELKCPHCPSTFISNNNLRRHLFELHKNEMEYLPEPPKIECDLPNMCRRCNMKFETKGEWIEHKVSEARVMRPFGPFQWGCDLCGAYVSRKEKLINHLHNHMKDQVIVPIEHPESKKDSPQQPKQVQNQEKFKKQSSSVQPEVPPKETQSNDFIPEFKKIKIPSLQRKQELDEESSCGGKDQYYDEDEDDDDDDDEEGDGDGDGEGETEGDGLGEGVGSVEAEIDSNENDAIVKGQQTHQDVVEEYDEDDFDDLAVGAQQTVGAHEDIDDEDDGDGDGDGDEEEDDDDDSSDADDEEPSTNEDTNEASNLKNNSTPIVPQPSVYNDTEQNDVDDDDDDDSDEFDDDDDDNSSTENRKAHSSVVSNVVVKSRHACDLCQLYFDTQQELQKHVKMHFLNGPGSVTLTEIKSSKSSSNKSRSSSSDFVTV